jgi:cation:H+ antiporter
MPAWLVFLISAAVVGGAGIRLARDGDVLGERTGLGGMWVGAILIAAATSLPELATDANAILQGSPGLAVGDLFGSCMANMAILAVADLLTRRTRMLTRVAINQALVASLAICLVTVAALAVLVGSGRGYLGLGAGTVVIGSLYLGGMRLLHRNRGEPPFRSSAEVPAPAGEPARLARPVIGLLVSAVAIFVAAPFLAAATAALAAQLGIGEGFAGMVLLAVTTSLPEMAVTYTCVRAGWYELAVGNLLGSTCFNMAALVPLDLIEGPGALLGLVEPSLAVGALFAALLTGLALLDILNRSERRLWIIEPGPALMLATYLIGLVLTFGAERSLGVGFGP